MTLQDEINAYKKRMDRIAKARSEKIGFLIGDIIKKHGQGNLQENVVKFEPIVCKDGRVVIPVLEYRMFGEVGFVIQVGYDYHGQRKFTYDEYMFDQPLSLERFYDCILAIIDGA